MSYPAFSPDTDISTATGASSCLGTSTAGISPPNDLQSLYRSRDDPPPHPAATNHRSSRTTSVESDVFNEATDLYDVENPEALHRHRSSSADSTRQSIQLDDIPSISKRYIYISYLIPIFLVTTAVGLAVLIGDPNDCNCDPNLPSYESCEDRCSSGSIKKDIYTYCGAALSIFGAVFVFISDRYMIHWKLHPNPLIYFKMIADSILAVVTMTNQAGTACSPAVAAMTQFCILSSETWFAIMAVDLVFSLQNPFISYKSLYPKYHLTCWGIGAISAFVLLADGATGTASADICWVEDSDSDERNVWKSNKNAFVYLYMWIFVYYLMSIFVFVVTICRINSGLKSTYMSRKRVLTRTAIILAIFMVYWAVMAGLYFKGIIIPDDEVVNDPDRKVHSPHNFATGAIWFLLPAKGFVTAVVWFKVNSLPSFLYHAFSKEGRETLRRKKLHFVGGDFSPQLNKALRREVLHFTTKGIIEAVSRNPNRPPSSWSMNALASNRNVDEFDIELEPDEIAHVAAEEGDVGDDGKTKPTFVGTSFFQGQIETTRRVKFKDYCPHVFARIRAAQGVSVGSYVKSLKNTAKEKLSAGASGAFMFFTKDGRYIVKSTTKAELKCLLRILVHYAEYVVNNKGSFLTRFLGCHSIKMYGKDYSFVVMCNIFNTNKVINQSYDIKGSWVNRHHDPIVKGKKVRCRHCNKYYIYSGQSNDNAEFCAENSRGCQPNVVLKDNDLNEKIRLEVSDADKTIEQLVADSELLASLGIMDYSLIMGVCNTEYEIQDHTASNRWPRANRTRRHSLRQSLNPKVKKRESSTGLPKRFNSALSSTSDQDRESEIESERGGEGRRTSVDGPDDIDSEYMMRSRCIVGPEFVFMGMIDMLQEWTWDKQVERWAKLLFKQVDGDGISAIEPETYKKRFQGKVHAIFEVEGYAGLESMGGSVGVYSTISFPSVSAPIDYTRNSRGGEERESRKMTVDSLRTTEGDVRGGFNSSLRTHAHSGIPQHTDV